MPRRERPLIAGKRTCRCHGKLSFFGSSVVLVMKNLYDLRSQIRFWILPKNAPLNSLLTEVTLRPLCRLQQHSAGFYCRSVCLKIKAKD